MKYNLPKKYLSYSAIDTWLKNPGQFRKRYYEGEEFHMTPELTFGKKIAELLENGDGSLAHIPRYNKPEQEINCTIDDVPVFGFIDSYDTERHAFLEYKTGKQPWDEARVKQHLQLDIYSLAIQTIFGKVSDTCHLIWMETERIEDHPSGRITHADAYGIRLTGKVHTFERVITRIERDATRQLLTDVARAISDDYTEYLQTKTTARKTSGGRIAA